MPFSLRVSELLFPPQADLLNPHLHSRSSSTLPPLSGYLFSLSSPSLALPKLSSNFYLNQVIRLGKYPFFSFITTSKLNTDFQSSLWYALSPKGYIFTDSQPHDLFLLFFLLVWNSLFCIPPLLNPRPASGLLPNFNVPSWLYMTTCHSFLSSYPSKDLHWEI